MMVKMDRTAAASKSLGIGLPRALMDGLSNERCAPPSSCLREPPIVGWCPSGRRPPPIRRGLVLARIVPRPSRMNLYPFSRNSCQSAARRGFRRLAHDRVNGIEWAFATMSVNAMCSLWLAYAAMAAMPDDSRYRQCSCAFAQGHFVFPSGCANPLPGSVAAPGIAAGFNFRDCLSGGQRDRRCVCGGGETVMDEDCRTELAEDAERRDQEAHLERPARSC